MEIKEHLSNVQSSVLSSIAHHSHNIVKRLRNFPGSQWIFHQKRCVLNSARMAKYTQINQKCQYKELIYLSDKKHPRLSCSLWIIVIKLFFQIHNNSSEYCGFFIYLEKVIPNFSGSGLWVAHVRVHTSDNKQYTAGVPCTKWILILLFSQVSTSTWIRTIMACWAKRSSHATAQRLSPQCSWTECFRSVWLMMEKWYSHLDYQQKYKLKKIYWISHLGNFTLLSHMWSFDGGGPKCLFKLRSGDWENTANTPIWCLCVSDEKMCLLFEVPFPCSILGNIFAHIGLNPFTLCPF